MDITVICGWVGALLFSICGLPQAWKCFREGHANGLSWGFLLMWIGGEVLCAIHIWDDAWTLPVFLNYMANIAMILVMLKFKAWPRTLD